MTAIYVRSTTGADTNDGLSWATAKATFAAAMALAVGGDTVYVSQAHSESASASKSFTSAGTPNNPVNIVCVQDGAEPPVAIADTGSVKTLSTGLINGEGSFAMYGMTISVGTGSNAYSLNFGQVSGVDVIQSFHNCSLLVGCTAFNMYTRFGNSTTSNSARSRFVLKNTNLRLNHTGQFIGIYQDFMWRGGAYAAGGATPSAGLFRVGGQGRTCRVEIDGVDFSALAPTVDLVSGPNATGRIMFRNCKLPASWTGGLVQGVVDPSLRVEMHNCDSIDTNYRFWVEAYAGSIKSETGTIKIGGASDGTTALSYKMTTNANVVWYLAGLESPELLRWNDTIDAPVTVSIHVLSDGPALTDQDAWLEVQHLGTSGVPLGVFESGRAATLAAPVVHPTASTTWNTAGMATPQMQRLSLTFTPREKGWMHIRIVVGKANATIYYDPKVV